MSIFDDRIMEILADDGAQTPSDIVEYDHIHRTRPNVNQRLKRLEEHDLVENMGTGLYRLTDNGWLYLIGGYNAQTGELTVHEEGEGAVNIDLAKTKYKKIRNQYLR
jgi:hypothetical protein